MFLFLFLFSHRRFLFKQSKEKKDVLNYNLSYFLLNQSTLRTRIHLQKEEEEEENLTTNIFDGQDASYQPTADYYLKEKSISSTPYSASWFNFRENFNSES